MADKRFFLFLNSIEYLPQKRKLIVTPNKGACFPSELVSLREKWTEAVVRRIIQVEPPADPERVIALDGMTNVAFDRAQDPVQASENKAYFGGDDI